MSGDKIANASNTVSLCEASNKDDEEEEEGEEEEDELDYGVYSRGESEFNSNGKKVRRHGYDGFRKNIRKARQVVLLNLTKAKRKLSKIDNKGKGRSASTVSISAPSRSISAIARSPVRLGTSLPDGNGPTTARPTGLYFCFYQPQVAETNVGSPTSDPEDPNFTRQMLRTFIEKNDFSSKECNPHLK